MNLLEIVHAPGFQQALVLATALCGGLWLMTVAARVDVTASNTPRKALAVYRTDTVDTPLEKLGSALMRRLPGLRNLLGLEGHRRWLLLEGQPWTVAASVGLAVLLVAAGCVLLVMSGMPMLGLAPIIGFLLPFVRQRSAAEKVRRRVQSNLPNPSAMLAAYTGRTCLRFGRRPSFRKQLRLADYLEGLSFSDFLSSMRVPAAAVQPLPRLA